MAQADWKPFHESILPIIAEMTIQDGATLFALIVSTRFPANWDKIADAWDKRVLEIYPPSAIRLLNNMVRVTLMEQKAESQSD